MIRFFESLKLNDYPLWERYPSNWTIPLCENDLSGRGVPGTPEKAKLPLRKWLRSGCFFMVGQWKSPEIKDFWAKWKGRQFLSKLPTFCGGDGEIRLHQIFPCGRRENLIKVSTSFWTGRWTCHRHVRTWFESLHALWKTHPPPYGRGCVFLAEMERFELSKSFWPLHDFQSCALDQLRDFSR